GVRKSARDSGSAGGGEKRAVDGDGKVLSINNIIDPLQPILPTLADRRGIQGRDIELDSRGFQLDSRPVNDAPPFRASRQELASIGDSQKNSALRWRRTTFPERRGGTCPTRHPQPQTQG